MKALRSDVAGRWEGGSARVAALPPAHPDEAVAEVGRALAREEGKTRAEAVGETRRAVAIFRDYAAQTVESDGEIYPSRSPLTFLYAARTGGVAKVNQESARREYHVPFGGSKESSSGSREQGKAACEFFTQWKTVYIDVPPGAGM